MSVESLTPANLWQLDRIGKEFTALAGLHGGFDIDIFSSNWRTMIAGNIGKIFVVRDNGIIVGCLGGVFILDQFNGRGVAMENFWFVLPEFRRSRAGIDLLDAFEAEAKQRNCKKILMAHLKIEGAEVLEKFYQKRGYSLIEQTFSKEI